MSKITFTRKPAPLADGAVACWTVHLHDGFETQIGTRLEQREHDWRMVFKDDKSVTVDTERDAMVLIQGLLLGRCLC